MVEFRQKILFLTPDNLRILHGSDSSVNCVSVFRRSVPIFLAKVILNIVPHIYIYIYTYPAPGANAGGQRCGHRVIKIARYIVHIRLLRASSKHPKVRRSQTCGLRSPPAVTIGRGGWHPVPWPCRKKTSTSGPWGHLLSFVIGFGVWTCGGLFHDTLGKSWHMILSNVGVVWGVFFLKILGAWQQICHIFERFQFRLI